MKAPIIDLYKKQFIDQKVLYRLSSVKPRASLLSSTRLLKKARRQKGSKVCSLENVKIYTFQTTLRKRHEYKGYLDRHL